MTEVTTVPLNNCLTLFYLKIRLYDPVKYMHLERIKIYLVFSNLICTGLGSTVHFSLPILKITLSCNQTHHPQYQTEDEPTSSVSNTIYTTTRATLTIC